MRRCLALLAALVLFSGLSGCGRLLGSRYDNFTAYYNTFYNAREAFERQEDQLQRQERPVERDRFLPVFIEPAEQSGRQEGFEKAVEKGADLLREHPESKWVDDALLLIGKAYFYQANFAGAEQKFREVIALDEDQHEDEARLWLGRTLTASESYDEAALTLREGLDREGLREHWAAQMRLAIAEVDVRRGDYEAAAEALRRGLDGLRDKELGARATFLLGQVLEVLDQPADAAEAYARVLDFGPRYELSYAAQLSRALTLARAGHTPDGLDLLSRMRRDDKHFQNLAEVELTRARVLAAAERPGEARALLRDLLYDPDPSLQAGGIRGQLHYYLAEIYREGLRDYVRAAAHYDTAATALRQPADPNLRLARQAITDAPARARTFGSYARVAAEIAEMDSLLHLGTLDDDAFAEAIEQIRAQRLEEEEARERELARRRAEQGFGGGPEGFDPSGGRPETGDPAPPVGPEGVGFLSFRNPVRVQEQLIGFQARWGDRPLVPNWRRAAAIGGGLEVQFDLEEVVETIPGVQTPTLLGDDLVDVSGIPRDPIAQQEMRLRRAEARYELGNVLFLALDEPEAAADWYRQVIEENPDSDAARQAYFALAETQRALGNEAEADDLYRQVLERYPDSNLADRVRERLGMDPRAPVVEADSLAEAEAAYALAYERWSAGSHAEALDAMLSVSERYPTTTVAARARLAAGALYAEWAAGDSTALLAPIPRLTSAAALDDDIAGSDSAVFVPLAIVPADSLAADSLAADGLATDSLAVETLAEDAFDDPWLYALYASIEEDYPGTPYAERARAIRTALTERFPTVVERRPVAGDSLATGDSLAAEAPAGSGVTAGPMEGPGTEELLGSRVRPDRGGFTWVVYSSNQRLEAEPVVRALGDLGYRSGLYVERAGGVTFHVLAGQFATEEEAEAARAVLPSVRGAAAPYVLPLEGKERWIQPPRALSGRNNQ